MPENQRGEARCTAGPEQAVKSIAVNEPGAEWSIDLAGPFPADKHGNTYICVAVDSIRSDNARAPFLNELMTALLRLVKVDRKAAIALLATV